MARIFISYARSDGSEVAGQLETALHESHHEPWLDKPNIEAGKDWSYEIEKAIGECTILLAVLTKGAYNSNICRGEQVFALEHGKRVIPLLVHADADRPIYLMVTHYLDFTNPAQFQSNFLKLLKQIETARGVLLDELPSRFRAQIPNEASIRHSGALLRGGGANWSEIFELASEQRNRFLEALSPRRGTVKVYEPALYTPRHDAEGELNTFIDSQVCAFLLVGDTGVGKTNLLCHWASKQVASGHAVLMYQCDRLRTEAVDHELLKDFGMENTSELSEALSTLEALARHAKKLLIVIFDGINEFRGNPQQLATSIDSLVARLPGTNLRIILSCTTATWNRLERVDRVHLAWGRYHRSRSKEVCVVLESFNDEEASAAFESYRHFFKLAFSRSNLPFALCTRLREPLLLRLVAETYQAVPDYRMAPTFDTRVFTRYYDERVGRHDDRFVIDTIVNEMSEKSTAVLPIRSLSTHPLLGPAVQSEDANSSYNRLLDLGVLVEMPGDLFQGPAIKFTYPLVGAYVLARMLSSLDTPLKQTIQLLVEKRERFSLAWDAAVALLVMRGDFEMFSDLAGASNPELRELASASLVKLQGIDRDRAIDILTQLLDSNMEEYQRTALRTAFAIGPDARELLLRGAMSRSPSLQQAVKDMLFLIWTSTSDSGGPGSASTVYFLWRHAQDFTRQMLQDLVARASWSRLHETIRIARFVLDWCITLYINHCDRPDVAKQVAELFYKLFVNQLHLDRFKLGSLFGPVVLRIVAPVFARPIMEWMLKEDPRHFFARPASERKALLEAAPLVDPTVNISTSEDLIQCMLTSEVKALKGTATLVLAIHSYANFHKSKSLHRRLFQEINIEGKIWQLIGFSVLLPDTPVEWVDLLEDMTQSIFEAAPQEIQRVAYKRTIGDLLFVPLGLAYGKRGGRMALFEELLTNELSNERYETAARIVDWLGPVGFYFPKETLVVLQIHLTKLVAQSACLEALTKALATIRTLHFDLVDSFVFRAGLDESFYRSVTGITDVQLIDHFMRPVGLYNNAVHQCLYYPRMRRRLTRFPLERLAEVDSATEFITDYATQVVSMVLEAKFDLLELTHPD